MSLTLHLVRKELRDVGWLLGGGLAALAAVAFGIAWFAADVGTERWAAFAAAFVATVVPAGALLAGVGVAAEAFAGDCASRRIDGAALLPVPLGRVFAAKLAATLFAWLAGGVAMAVIAPFAVVSLGDGGEATAVMPEALFVASLTLPPVLGVVAFACVLEQGVAAVMSGVAVVGAIGYGAAAFLPWMEWGITDPRVVAMPAVVVTSVILVVAARGAFARGGIHLGTRGRRAAIALGGGFGAVLLAGSAVAYALDVDADLHPGDGHARIRQVNASPDGAFVMIPVSDTRGNRTNQAWCASVEGGRVMRLPGRDLGFIGWDASNRAVFWGTPVYRRFDPRTGEWDTADLGSCRLEPSGFVLKSPDGTTLRGSDRFAITGEFGEAVVLVDKVLGPRIKLPAVTGSSPSFPWLIDTLPGDRFVVTYGAQQYVDVIDASGALVRRLLE